MKKTFALLFCCAFLLLSSIPAFAAEDDGAPETTITSGSAEDADSAQDAGEKKTAGAADATSGMEPIEVRMETLNGVPYITRVYELADATAALPDSRDFEQDSYTFSLYDTHSRQEADEVETHFATKTVTVPLAEDSPAALQETAAPYIEYSENGFTGRLQYAAGDVTIVPDGQESYSYRVTDVREYNALDRNDAAYIPKTVTKNGVTLTLEGIEWVVMGTVPDGDSLVPNLFKAIATYSGTAAGTRASGYTATINYSGTVTKTTPGKLLYSIVYRGELTVATVAEAQPDEKSSIWPGIFITLGIFVALGGAGTAAFLLIRRRRRMEDEQVEFEELVEKGEW